MLASMSARQLDEWERFFALEPWGEQRADWRTAQIASILANVYRRTGASAFKPADFMIDQRTESEKRRDATRELKRQILEREMRTKARERALQKNGGA